MDGDGPDAVRVQPDPGWREVTISPGHAAVWVRVRGTWRKGHITAWLKVLSVPAAWDCEIQEDAPTGISWGGRYMYDPRSIRPRHDDSAPTRSSEGLGLAKDLL
jgi:hypothetical protein